MALFTSPTAPSPKPREHCKRQCSSLTTEGDEARDRKKERTDLEAARKASLIDEESRQIRPHELDASESSSRMDVFERITTEGADTAVGTIDGVHIEGAGSGKPDPPAC